MVGSQELPVPRRCWSIWGLVVSLGNNSGLWQEQPGTDCYVLASATALAPALVRALPVAVVHGDIQVVALLLRDRRVREHLWNNELHYEEIPHCEKLIVNNEPLLAHYQNNELGSLYLKPQ